MENQQETEEMECGFVDKNDCAIVETVVEFLRGGRVTPPATCQPEKLVASHFVNPLRTLGAVHRLLAGESGCEMFRTPERAHSEWCVLESRDSEVERALEHLNQTQPPGKAQDWEYILSKPSWEDGRWRHGFRLMEMDGKGKAQTLNNAKIPAASGWVPESSGLSFVLRDVCMGQELCERVPRRDLLFGLASHLAGKNRACAPRFDGDGVATLQWSPTRVRYVVYTVCDGGPTHMFTEDER